MFNGPAQRGLSCRRKGVYERYIAAVKLEGARWTDPGLVLADLKRAFGILPFATHDAKWFFLQLTSAGR